MIAKHVMRKAYFASFYNEMRILHSVSVLIKLWSKS